MRNDLLVLINVACDPRDGFPIDQQLLRPRDLVESCPLCLHYLILCCSFDTRGLYGQQMFPSNMSLCRIHHTVCERYYIKRADIMPMKVKGNDYCLSPIIFTTYNFLQTCDNLKYKQKVACLYKPPCTVISLSEYANHFQLSLSVDFSRLKCQMNILISLYAIRTPRVSQFKRCKVQII